MGVIVRVPSMGQIELYNHLLNLKPFDSINKWIMLKRIISVRNTWNHLTVCKQVISIKLDRNDK